MKSQHVALSALLLVVAIGVGQAAEPREAVVFGKTKTRNILLVTTDGLRWQEVFGGADAGAHEQRKWRRGECGATHR